LVPKTSVAVPALAIVPAFHSLSTKASASTVLKKLAVVLAAPKEVIEDRSKAIRVFI
jgi:hypothetical protein